MALSTAGQLTKFGYSVPAGGTLYRYFNLDGEGNIPAFFSGVQILCAALISFILARSVGQEGRRFGWALLGFGMVAMSLDEVTQIHELGHNFKKLSWVPDSPWLKFVWVLPAAAVVLVVWLSLLGFLRRVPRRVGWNLLAGGFVFVFGALGLETLGGYMLAKYTWTSWQYVLCMTAEEVCEMLGIAWYLRTCLRLGETTWGPFQVGWGRVAKE